MLWVDKETMLLRRKVFAVTTTEANLVFYKSHLMIMVSLFSSYDYNLMCLKVPKRENFSLTFFTLSEPIWVCDLGTGPTIDVFIN